MDRKERKKIEAVENFFKLLIIDFIILPGINKEQTSCLQGAATSSGVTYTSALRGGAQNLIDIMYVFGLAAPNLILQASSILLYDTGYFCSKKVELGTRDRGDQTATSMLQGRWSCNSGTQRLNEKLKKI
ncbi:hypothetical protein TNCV_2302531 [Trichonephila clavipes]|nr:hypothetical protein TNCV_2302531 [Trichonephila clavipes]